MKKNIISLLVVSSVLLVGCSTQQPTEEKLNCSHINPCSTFEQHDSLIEEENDNPISGLEAETPKDEVKEPIKDNDKEPNDNDNNNAKPTKPTKPTTPTKPTVPTKPTEPTKPDPNPDPDKVVYRVNVASFKEKENAERLVKEIKNLNHDAFYDVAWVNEETCYRVSIGSFENKDNAYKLVNELKALGYDAFISEFTP